MHSSWPSKRRQKTDKSMDLVRKQKFAARMQVNPCIVKGGITKATSFSGLKSVRFSSRLLQKC